MSLVIDSDRFRHMLRLQPELAIEQLSKYHLKDLYKISFGLTGSHVATQEIVQETLIHVWEKRKELSANTHQSIQHYLVKVVRNKSISYFTLRERLRIYAYRYQRRERNALDVAPVESSIVNAERDELVWRILENFPRRERECLMMRFVDELSPDDIAARLGIGRKAVEGNITRANKRLREYAHLFK